MPRWRYTPDIPPGGMKHLIPAIILCTISTPAQAEVVIPCTAQADALHARCDARNPGSMLCDIISDWHLRGCCTQACIDYHNNRCNDREACIEIGLPRLVCEAEGAAVRLLCPRDAEVCREVCEAG